MLDDKILTYFKGKTGNYVSGEDVAESFGISRAAVWKHIEKFREEGYEIEALPHLGYKLVSAPDRLSEMELKWKLNTGIIGKKIYSYKEIDSTNDAAYKLAVSGAPEGTCVVSEYQTKGRGRLGRKWISPKDKGAYLSIILRPDIPPNEAGMVTLFSALAIANSIRETVSLPAFIKWPNDVFINEKKVCGILTEMNGELDKIHFVVIGIGININAKTELLPEGATSLAEEKGEQVSRLEFTQALLRNLDKYYNLFNRKSLEDIVAEYKKLCLVLDKQVQIHYDNELISGNAVDIDKEGALILRMDSGFQKRVLAGDVVMLR
ncbi:MAG: biotin--[acetyl-CoA-carboxylase] ligase [Candidatus Omnitrophota bacterium]|jgi:BirA family biotin operon repressor/biotin-[acetyl-CoA-carboxylase] ligase|nr:biotin--[acetyl-CoA-carboxylase] ligase [Candidatus Omnitrophota bacterium]